LSHFKKEGEGRKTNRGKTKKKKNRATSIDLGGGKGEKVQHEEKSVRGSVSCLAPNNIPGEEDQRRVIL